MKEDEQIFNFQISDLREIPIENFSYIGDAVIGLIYKVKLFGDGRNKVGNMFENSKKFLSAQAHSKFIDLIYDSFNEIEKQYYKRAVNSQGAKKRGNDYEYRKSTGFEAVIGYLFLTKNYRRIQELLGVIDSCMFMEKTL